MGCNKYMLGEKGDSIVLSSLNCSYQSFPISLTIFLESELLSGKRFILTDPNNPNSNKKSSPKPKYASRVLEEKHSAGISPARSCVVSEKN